MKKNVKYLLYTDMLEICKKYYNKDFYDTCKDCPLRVKQIHCLKGLLDEQAELIKKLGRVDGLIKEFLTNNKEMEIEV